MNTSRRVQYIGALFCAFSLVRAAADVTFVDNFASPVNYLTNGIQGTMWDGLYLGAGDLANGTSIGAGAGTVSVADANQSSANQLTIASVQTDWENTADDGVFLFKVITGNFDMSVQVIGPIDTGAYNFPGLMVRAFGPEGAPAPGGQENSLLWGRFDQYSIANMSKNNVNGVKSDIGRGTYPNSNYWLRMTRSGNTLRLYEKATAGGAWTQVGSVTRADFSGLLLQAGIEHADFGGGATRIAHYANFSLTVTNWGPFATQPAAPSSLTARTNAEGNVALNWSAGAGSAGSLVVVWPATNSVVKQAPANGFTYTANANYGVGSSLPGTGYYVVYAGTGSGVTVSNLPTGATYNIAVFAYAGSGNSIAYNHTPALATAVLPVQPPREIWAGAQVVGNDVAISFTANPGKWYWLQYSDSLSPANWQNVVPGPVFGTNILMAILHAGGATGSQRYYRLQQVDPLFGVRLGSSHLTSLKRTQDSFDTEYIAGGQKLGDATIRYRQTGANWLTAQTATLSGIASAAYSGNTNSAGTEFKATYQITNSLSGTLAFGSAFQFQQDAIVWTLNLTNSSAQAVEIGDLACPLPMNTTFSTVTSSVFKHSLIAGDGSFIFWMRPNSVGPYLVMIPSDGTHLEYWDNLSGSYEVYIHSLAAGAIAAAQGTHWQQTNTSLMLPAGTSQSYAFKFRWADDYDGVRQVLVDEGKVDVHVVPGMTVPTNLLAEIALRTTQAVTAVEAEFPSQTQIQFLGNNGDYRLYGLRFSRLGENRVTIRYGNSRQMGLEFFVTEPVETLIAKRAAFLVGKQVQDSSKWYDGLYPEWNMSSQVLVTPDNYDLLVGFVRYEVASDDAGLSRPAYMAAKNAVFPVQSEVTSLDYYIQNFVWGGLQRTTNETYAYGIYGVQDWYSNRTSSDPGTGGQLHLWRIYDYPHIVVMYYGMYQVAKYHPEITTALSAREYLLRAYGTANALFTVPLALVGWSAYQTGLMNELVIADLIADLEAEGFSTEAATLRNQWEQKVNFFVTGNPDLFGSEYSFDSTGFETQQALARYGFEHANTLGATNPAVYLQQARQFMDTQIAANILARGWLETAYFYYGSDYRSHGGDDYVLSYMSQMGGWGLLDYALNFATNATDYLRLGYASSLSAWALMNTGTPDSNYGFWYPGLGNDGACGGGFEPSPYNTTWLGQPSHRGSWYYSCEENLGYCGAIRSAATVLADDAIFGRFCYGGDWTATNTNVQVTLKDGVRRRFHAILNTGNVHLILENDNFSATQPVGLKEDFSDLRFTVETGNLAGHTARLKFSSTIGGSYAFKDAGGTIAVLDLGAGEQGVVALPIGPGISSKAFFITR